MEEELEDAGDLLPTFYHNYDFYKKNQRMEGDGKSSMQNH